MKTIKQIADEIGVSKQAVQKRMNREPLCTQLQTYIHTKSGTKYIEVVGENLIKSAFMKSDDTTVADNQPTTSIDVVYILKQQLEEKDRQLQEKDNQLKEKDNQISELFRLQSQQQELQLRLLSENKSESPKKHFWNKLIGKQKN